VETLIQAAEVARDGDVGGLVFHLRATRVPTSLMVTWTASGFLPQGQAGLASSRLTPC
jgi:hypothetical protein